MKLHGVERCIERCRRIAVAILASITRRCGQVVHAIGVQIVACVTALLVVHAQALVKIEHLSQFNLGRRERIVRIQIG